MTITSPLARRLTTRQARVEGTKRRGRGWRAAAVVVALSGAAIGGLASPGIASGGDDDTAFRQVNLVSDLPGVAKLLDNEVKNPWGIAMGPNTPLWVSNNHNPALAGLCETCFPAPKDLLTKVTLYRGENGREPITKVALEVTASLPTGIVFNPTSSFEVTQGGLTAPARFLFNEAFINDAGDDIVAKITGWSNASTPTPTTTAATRATKNGVAHVGLTLVPAGSSGSGPGNSQPVLLAADGNNPNTIDVFDGTFNRIQLPGSFVDPGAAELIAYNVAFLKERVYVTYVNESGGGALSVFTRDGRFIKRLVTDGPLVGPWAMTIAPEDWGDFGGALLVGNVDDGRINAFNRRNGHLLGTLSDSQGNPLVNPGLWGLAFGNGTIGTPNTLLFAAGIGKELDIFAPEVYEHGLVGLIEPIGR